LAGDAGKDVDYLLVLRPVPDACPVAVRLRRLLKAALRAFGLKVIDLRELPRDQGPAPPP
jgi:hypothetical protein